MPRFLPVQGGFSVAHSILRDAAAYWKLASEGVVDLEDYAGDNDLTNNNSVTRAAGPSANLPDAASFVRASTQYLSQADLDAAIFSAGTFELTGWLYLDNLTNLVFPVSFGTTVGDQRAIQLRVFATSGNWNFEGYPNGVATGVQTVGSAETHGSLSAETWYFCSLGYDFAAKELFASINLSTEAQVSLSGIFESSGPFQLGALAGANSLDGRETQWQLHPRKLTPAERTWLFNDGDGRALF